MTIAIDLDGCLAKFDEWRGMAHIGDPYPGVQTVMWELVEHGHKLLVYSCRCTDKEQRDKFGDGYSCEESAMLIHKWLKKHVFPPMLVHIGGKPLADLYIDDKAMRVDAKSDPWIWYADKDLILKYIKHRETRL